MRNKKVDNYIETIREAITKMKLQERNPKIIFAGDVNNYNIDPAFSDSLDFVCHPSPPTRQGERLDLIYSNVSTMCTPCMTSPPLETEGGIQSDHLILECKLNIPHVHEFQWIRYRAREMTQKNHEKFKTSFTGVNWEEKLQSIECPSDMTEVMHSVINQITDECFPWKERKIRSTDDPWITDEIRKPIKRHKKKFNKQRRSKAWYAIKDLTRIKIKTSKAE